MDRDELIKLCAQLAAQCNHQVCPVKTEEAVKIRVGGKVILAAGTTGRCFIEDRACGDVGVSDWLDYFELSFKRVTILHPTDFPEDL